MKLVISGLPGCGASSLALLASYHFGLSLIKGSASFRYIAQHLGAVSNNDETLIIEKEVQPYWGPVYDKFVSKLLSSESLYNDICIDSDIAGFMSETQHGLIRVFLHANMTARTDRFSTDQRSASPEFIKEIDQKLQREYQQLYGFDFLNLEFVRTKYEILIDNSDLTLAEELNLIQTHLQKENILGQYINQESFDELERDFWLYGKSHFTRLLESKNLVRSGPEVIKMVVESLSDDIKSLPEKLQNIILSIK
jgi:cytidylate kinase